MYLGANLEYLSLGLDHCIHAEEFVVSLAMGNDERRLTCLAISAFPCGYCRQMLIELEGSGELKIFVMQTAPGCAHDGRAESKDARTCVGTPAQADIEPAAHAHTVAAGLATAAAAEAAAAAVGPAVLGPFRLGELLPHAFGPVQLGNEHRLLTPPAPMGLELAATPRGGGMDWGVDWEEDEEGLRRLAAMVVEFAGRSYCVSFPARGRQRAFIQTIIET